MPFCTPSCGNTNTNYKRIPTTVFAEYPIFDFWVNCSFTFSNPFFYYFILYHDVWLMEKNDQEVKFDYSTSSIGSQSEVITL